MGQPLLQQKGYLLLLFFMSPFLISNELAAQVISTTGNIFLDLNDDNQHEASLSSTGLGIGDNLVASANLHVGGNALISRSLVVGSSSSSQSNLFISGTFSFDPLLLSSNTSISNASYVLADSSGGNISLALPNASTVGDGRVYTIKKISADNDVLVGGGDDIDGQSGVKLNSGDLGFLKIISSSGNWSILSASGNGGLDWSPSLLSPEIWLDASDLSTVSEVTGNVSLWSDKSGQEIHLTQSNNTYQPYYNSTGFNGRPTLEFRDGVGSGGSSLGNNLSGNKPRAGQYSIFAVINSMAANAGDEWFGCFYTTAKEDRLKLGSDMGWSSDPSNGRARMTHTTGQMIIEFKLDSTVPGMLINAVDVTTTSSTGYVEYEFNGGGSTGLTVGGRNFGNGHANCDMDVSEIIHVRKTYLSEGTREKIEGYLAHKWGLEASLPVGHRYRNVAP